MLEPRQVFKGIRASRRCRFPRFAAGRLLHHPFRGLLGVHSHSGLYARQVAIATLYTGGFSGFVTSAAAPIATGRNDSVPGRDLHPLKNSDFSRRTRKLGELHRILKKKLDDR